MDKFTEAYITCALWSSNDESREDGGDPMDKNYSLEDLAPETLRTMEADCHRFQSTAAEHIGDDSQAGHDFWLTRNGHGAGFWDGAYWPEPAATILTDLSKEFGEFNLIVGDDGQIHS